ncbi:Protocadherin Alpha-2 [Manis pentadactyla]|nr:Protocadherin Alpha-2 [Manis pentadactyla]
MGESPSDLEEKHCARSGHVLLATAWVGGGGGKPRVLDVNYWLVLDVVKTDTPGVSQALHTISDSLKLGDDINVEGERKKSLLMPPLHHPSLTVLQAGQSGREEAKSCSQVSRAAPWSQLMAGPGCSLSRNRCSAALTAKPDSS